MASRAANALAYMNRMVEISEVRQVMHAHPLQRLASLETGANLIEIWTVRPNLFMAAHANLGRRHPGGSRLLHRRMTVTAIDAVVADVMLVTKLNGLLALDVLSGVPA